MAISDTQGALAGGRSYLAIPGPSVVPDRVLNAMHRASPNIYQGGLIDMVDTLIPDLKRVARTKAHVAIYIANGHGAWEAAFANTLAPGDRVLALICGRFGQGWAQMARDMGLDVEELDFGRASPIDPARVEAALRADKEGRIKAVLATHVDTSTSALSDMSALRAAMDAAGHPALLMADCIASFACDRFEMDEWGVDILVTGSQKGLMMPPGLGLVFFSEKAAQVRRGLARVSPYWDWTLRANPDEFYQYFFGTAPTHHLYGMRAALDMIHDEGVEAVWARHDRLARAIWAACEVWAEGGALKMNIIDPAQRSRAVTALSLPAPKASDLRAWLEANAGVTLGVGLGFAMPSEPAWHGYFRIGHMGHVNAHMVLGVLGSIEAGLAALDIPHGSGAVGAAAAVIAKG
ncbi:alanine-glyoxylate transaminase / serine-glyoxylate transaminase / serine-pyruvate transaminase [Roseovarius nanhaiticus]|uniref:Alanine-glyoxylate transaminase / serine-glyoxylate transaminase / serine-pyruvate transaminase n=1 Tax=Roseovarius nanhaiticus TaxID=573024 RepID=A0A1N7H4B8_9RHOB|nr:aminotransferase class V-fold PLP-dependent enzyme [Roseovarius nanhaiticus]SEL13989.1 alanine-glyoxylate transaminase / serine-glyoxylate transaminase / serine-pyruvate transaminase [Roseovarius nanhaiticus]SIS19570.1 alanine-glyoxylate transaminase / serine-glyoxylate transaminase / serine-pyruvate transaminase [Roseovarius nanhaiticus]